jgi:DNA-binding NarL/FixJ family response regulator
VRQCLGMPPEPSRVRVLVADDEESFVELVSILLALEDGIELVGSARDGAEAVELARTLAPDVVLMDVDMSGMNGFEATEQIVRANSSARVVILTGTDTDADDARRAGATGYVSKQRVTTDLRRAIDGEP